MPSRLARHGTLELLPTKAIAPARFSSELLTRPPPGWLAAQVTLRHFAIVTYALPPERLRPHVDPRLELETAPLGPGGEPRALVSAVPFLDWRFRAARFWTPPQRFGQTNYRAYVRERETGRRAVWFFGTTLDSPFVLVPRHLWRLPWHAGTMRFACEFEGSGPSASYRRYALTTTRCPEASADLELEGTGEQAGRLDGFDDEETGLVVVTHPLVGYYRRRDGRLGSYSIWHDRLRLERARARRAYFSLFERLGLLSAEEQRSPHSALVQPEAEFTIYLPPRLVA